MDYTGRYVKLGSGWGIAVEGTIGFGGRPEPVDLKPGDFVRAVRRDGRESMEEVTEIVAHYEGRYRKPHKVVVRFKQRHSAGRSS